MSKKKFILQGALFGAVVSFLIASIFTMVVRMVVGGYLFGTVLNSGERWLYFAVIIPFSMAFAWLGGYFFDKKQVRTKTLWKISFMTTLFILLYCGTIGVIFWESIIQGKFETINVSDTLGWGMFYAFVLTPFFTPITLLLINVFTELILKLESYTD
ncbi:hypothetical protein [Lysinibacillus sp. LZ02]|uniref:hypothetical protein n=1 Tax=Lysinibacillus sp. LZ02 TaxID=3420668 RepID=UPI003D35A7F4